MRRRNRLHTVGALDGLSTADLLLLDQVGPETVTEIVGYLRCLGTGTATRVTARDDKPTVADLPSHLIRVPISSLALDRWTVQLLDTWGCHTLGDLLGCDLARVLSPARVARLSELVAVLRTIPLEKLAEMSWGTEPADAGVPALSAELLRSIASAKTLDQEVEALCASLGDRNRNLVLARLRYRSDERVTFEELGNRNGITRERVRQIVNLHLARLAESGLRLPIGSRVVREIDLAGGIASAEALVERLSAEEVLTDRLSVNPLRELSAIGLVPKIRWDSETGVWVGLKGRAAWIETGQLSDVRRRLKGKARDDLRRVGAVKESALEDLSPFDVGHASTLVAPRGTSLRRVLGYLVPEPSPNSSLVRQARKVLAVTTPLSIVELHSGLLRNPRLGPLPPRDLVEIVLKQHPAFEVAGGRARLRGKPPRTEILSKSERALVELLEEHDGVILFRDMVDGMKRRGFSQPTTSMLTRSPILTRVATAVYALRGRHVPNQLLSARLNV
ncbi:sigma factor-like helix-turn-helix DNA-binding protein [Candidatus Palauibacter sp.]|uniref:sigma factor-like helix-turn-helix DNA-binding protein n=1 Tax=Candidatus Palauibacter sp. TaxID=3101350 RepID=UPI003B026C79